MTHRDRVGGPSGGVGKACRWPRIAGTSPPTEETGIAIVGVQFSGYRPLAENLGKPSLWVMINAPWYYTSPRRQGRLIDAGRAKSKTRP